MSSGSKWPKNQKHRGNHSRFAPPAERDSIGDLTMQITAEACARYDLHRRARRRILADLGAPDAKLNQKLTVWWELDFPDFCAEVQKVFRREILLKDRDDWEEWLQARRAEHRARAEAIVSMETDVNARVYALFDLTPVEIRMIEERTKYQYWRGVAAKSAPTALNLDAAQGGGLPAASRGDRGDERTIHRSAPARVVGRHGSRAH
jgi:hypothetical protein